MAQPFDATSLRLSGEPFPVLEQLAIFKGVPKALYSISANGVLAWRPRSTLEPTQLAWFNRSGEKLGTLGDPALVFGAVLSPDERSVAVSRRDTVTSMNSRRDIWIYDVARGTTPRRLTFDPADEMNPVWSPDGSRIAYSSDRRGVREIYQKRTDGSGDEELLLASTVRPLFVEDWSPDGRFIVYSSPMGLPNKQDLFLLPLSPAAERKPVPFLETDAVEFTGAIAPNGRWLAYRSQEAGRGDVYVSDLSPRGQRGPGKWQVSTGGGFEPRWRRDGKELFYVAGSTIMAVAVKPDAPSFEAGTPRPLFDVPLTGAGAEKPLRRHSRRPAIPREHVVEVRGARSRPRELAAGEPLGSWPARSSSRAGRRLAGQADPRARRLRAKKRAARGRHRIVRSRAR